MVLCGNLNGHVGKAPDGYEGVQVGNAFGLYNTEGERVLEFCDAIDMIVSITLFKRIRHW